MVKMAVVELILPLRYTTTVPLMIAFAEDSEQWYTCVITRMIISNDNTEAALETDISYAESISSHDCPSRPKTTPSVPVLMMSNFAASAVALIPGLIFATR
jgi:hypothetical protein